MSGAYGGDAFGLRISSAEPIPGITPLDVRPAPRTSLRVVDEPGALSRRAGNEVLYRSDEGEPPHLLIDRRAGGYGVWSPRMGRFQISADGTEILAAVPRGRSWPWQLLFAQTLPITAAIQGYEVLHASAVAIDGGVVAIVAPSGSGKSTLAFALVRRGAAFVADDVVTVESVDGTLLAHPGAGVVNASAEEVRRGIPHESRLARGAKHHLVVARAPGPLPLRALVLLERTGAKARPSIERISEPDPFMLLGSTFVFVVKEAQRLIRQLDIHQAIASSVPVLHARLPRVEDPDRLAELVEAQLP